jgi:hypothetical protein
MIILDIFAISFLAFYALWTLFVCVMHLRKVRDSKERVVVWWKLKFNLGGLPWPSYLLGWPLLIVGYTIDVFCNVVLLTTILAESPRLDPDEGPVELTVTARLRRHARSLTGRRKAFAVFVGSNFTDPFDLHHILPEPDLNQPA